MILAQIRRDHAWRVFPFWGILLTLNVLLITGMVAAVAARRQEPLSTTGLLVLGWATTGLYLAFGRPGRRGDLFDLALPISARGIWLAHVLSIALGGTILVAGCVAAAAYARVRIGGGASGSPGLFTLALLLESGTLLAAVQIQAPHPSLVRVPPSATRAAWVGLVLLAELALLAGLAPLGPPGGGILLALAVLAAVLAYRAVPQAFTVAPLEAQKGAVPAALPADARPVTPASPEKIRWTVLLATLRCLSTGVKDVAIYFFIVLFGFFIGGGMPAFLDSSSLRDLRYLYLPMVTYILASFLGPRLVSLHRLDPLPLSRRLLFAGLILPTALVLAASYGAGVLVASRVDPRIEYVNFQPVEKQSRWEVTVPLRVYRFARAGAAPVLTSPWGESHPAEGTPLFRGSATILYSPYGTPPGSSARFVAWQISQAARTVYGLAIPPEEVERRWLETRPDGTVAGKLASLPIHAEHPDLHPASGPLFPVMILLACVPWLLLTALLFRCYRPGVVPRVRQAVYWGGMGILLVTFLALCFAGVAGATQVSSARALVEIPVWTLGATLAGTAAAWLASALLLLGSYFFAERMFLRMEVPARPTKYTILACPDEP